MSISQLNSSVNNFEDEFPTSLTTQSRGTYLSNLMREITEAEKPPVIDYTSMPGESSRYPYTRICEAPVRTPPNFPERSSSQKSLKQRLNEYYDESDPGRILLVKGTPGIGKSHVAAEFTLGLIGKHYNKKVDKHGDVKNDFFVAYLGPRKDFYVDMTTAFGKLSTTYTEYVRRWLAKNEPGMCVDGEGATAFAIKGYPSKAFCSITCGVQFMGNGCSYFGQIEDPEPVVFGQHAHLTHPMPGMERFKLLIIDECPAKQFEKDLVVGLSQILIKKQIEIYRDGLTYTMDYFTSPEGIELVDNLFLTASKMVDSNHAEKQLSGRKLLDKLGGAQRVKDILTHPSVVDFCTIVTDDRTDFGEMALNPLGLPPNYFPILRKALLKEAEEALKNDNDYECRVFLSATGLRIWVKELPQYSRLPKHIIIFDGTGNKEYYEKWFGMPVEIFDMSIPQTGRIHVVDSHANGKWAFMDAEGELNESKIKRTEALTECIKRKFPNPDKVAVISYQALDEIFKTNGLHFWGSRGSNFLVDHDYEGLIVVGTPNPNPNDLRRSAAILEIDRMEPFDMTYGKEWVKYGYVGADGKGYEREVGTYLNEPILNMLQRQLREAEIEQTVHRLRPLVRDVDVWLLSSLPMPELEICEVVNQMTAAGVPDGHSGLHIETWNTAWKFALQSTGVITAKDLAKAIGVKEPAAREYLDALADRPEFDMVTVPEGKHKVKALMKRDLEIEPTVTYTKKVQMSIDEQVLTFALSVEVLTRVMLEKQFGLSKSQANRHMANLREKSMFAETQIEDDNGRFVKGLTQIATA